MDDVDRSDRSNPRVEGMDKTGLGDADWRLPADVVGLVDLRRSAAAMATGGRALVVCGADVERDVRAAVRDLPVDVYASVGPARRGSRTVYLFAPSTRPATIPGS